MSALDITAIVVAWGALLVIVGRDRIRDVLNDLHAGPDRRRHIAECSAREGCGCDGSGVRLVEGLCDAAPVEVPCSCQSQVRLRSGAALAEALWLQVLEIRNLPEAPGRSRRLA